MDRECDPKSVQSDQLAFDQIAPAHSHRGQMSMSMNQVPSRAHRHQGGFSLLVVFAIMALMAAMAASVLLTSRSDIRVAGRQRESTVSFFTAEAGVAYAKVYLATRWNTVTFWTSALTDPARTADYHLGGFALGGGGTLPQLRSRYTFSFRNNPDDLGLNPLLDTDGRVIIRSVGEALDEAGTNVIARTTVEVEVEYGAANLLKGSYGAQANQSAAGTASSLDVNAVQMNQSTGL